MRLLLDEWVPRVLARELPGHDVRTVRQMEWLGVKNGRLLARASEHFDAFITVDQKIAHEQNLQRLPIAVVILKTQSNRLESLIPLVPDLLATLDDLQPRTLILLP